MGRFKLGENGLPEYQTWINFRRRVRERPRYAALGFDPRWHTFKNFLFDMGAKPSPLHTLDRIDNEKGYSKDNCRWATMKTQSNNRNNNRMFTYKSKTMNMGQWCAKLGIKRDYVYRHLRKGETINEILTNYLQVC